MNVKKLIKAFGYASEGIAYHFKHEQNAKIQSFAAVMVIIAAFYFEVSKLEWIVLLLSIALVVCLEMVNTAIERVCEMLSKEIHPTVKIIKDVAAGAVWTAALFAAIVGCIIFIPHLKRLIF